MKRVLETLKSWPLTSKTCTYITFEVYCNLYNMSKNKFVYDKIKLLFLYF